MARSEDDDEQFLERVPVGVLREYRDKAFPKAFVDANPSYFLDVAWARPLVGDIKLFIQQAASSDPTSSRPRKPIVTPRVQTGAIKLEEDNGRAKHIGRVKIEEASTPLSVPPSSAIPTRVLEEDGREVIEILDSDSDADCEPGELHLESLRKSPSLSPSLPEVIDFTLESSSAYASSDRDTDYSDYEPPIDISLDDEDFSPIRHKSDTTWLDPDVSSEVLERPTKITRQLSVHCVEFVKGLPSYYPIPRFPTAYLLDLSDSKYNLVKKGQLLTVDALIKDKDQDSWHGSTGGGKNDSTAELPAWLFYGDGEAPSKSVTCRRSRLRCSGYAACEHLEEKLKSVSRYELDQDSLPALVESQAASRVDQASSVDARALTFFSLLCSRTCTAVDDDGSVCDGTPLIRKFNKGKVVHGKSSFIACSGWTPKWRSGHTTINIPADVSEDHLERIFSGEVLQGVMSTCTRIVPAHVGLKLKRCAYNHRGNGAASLIKQHTCPASRKIFVPVDSALRFAVVIPDFTSPHSHPVLPPLKTPYDVRIAFQKCVEALGVAGCTGQSVDTALSTKLLLGGKTPAQFHPSLHSKRKKSDLVRATKNQHYPNGQGIEGVLDLFKKEREETLPSKRYIHHLTTTPTGGFIIFTCLAELLGLVHSARSLEVDTTFKRVSGSLKEWEITIWHEATERAVTVGRVYTDKADREHYKTIFDEFQRLTLSLTGRPLRFKRLTEGGNLLSLGVDLEAAQVLGAGDSFLPTNEPAYSGITTSEAEVLVTYFVRACVAHINRGINDLKGALPTAAMLDRLQSFPSLRSEDELASFDEWIQGLNNPKILNWWNHKKQHKWIFGVVLQCKSGMNPTDWDLVSRTTNINEEQHHWTARQTGTNLSLLDAILTAKVVDLRTADELRGSLQTGVLTNNRNELSHRLANSISRSKTQATKNAARQEEARTKENLAEGVGTQAAATKRRRRAGPIAESSSSGRVPPSKLSKGKARELSTPYQVPSQAMALPPSQLDHETDPIGTMPIFPNLSLETQAITATAPHFYPSIGSSSQADLMYWLNNGSTTSEHPADFGLINNGTLTGIDPDVMDIFGAFEQQYPSAPF